MITSVIFIRIVDDLRLAMIGATQPVLVGQKIYIEDICYAVLEVQWVVSKTFGGFVKCFVREFVE